MKKQYTLAALINIDIYAHYSSCSKYESVIHLYEKYMPVHFHSAHNVYKTNSFLNMWVNAKALTTETSIVMPFFKENISNKFINVLTR